MNVGNIFQGIANKMLVDFDQIHEEIVHYGVRGDQREQTVRDFLIKYLPKKYSVGTGHILDLNGQMSGQCDVVIYDSFNCPLILVEDGYQIFPVESVLAVIEVKSTFTAKSMEEAALNIQKVKVLERDEPIAGCMFAFRSNYTSENPICAAAEAFLLKSKDIPPSERIDLVCVLAEGQLWHYKGEPEWGRNYPPSENIVQALIEPTPPNLLLFLMKLQHLLSERTTTVPTIAAYNSSSRNGIDIGVMSYHYMCPCGGMMDFVYLYEDESRSDGSHCKTCDKLYKQGNDVTDLVTRWEKPQLSLIESRPIEDQDE